MKLRLKDHDYVIIYDALQELRSVESNKVCSDYAELNGIHAMREAEKRTLHCVNLMERIRKARLSAAS